MNKKSLAEVALLTESEAAKMFKMGTTRFKARYVNARARTTRRGHPISAIPVAFLEARGFFICCSNCLHVSGRYPKDFGNIYDFQKFCDKGPKLPEFKPERKVASFQVSPSAVRRLTVFSVSVFRFPFLRCRDLGISRWPHRKLMSLKNLYSDLVKHLQHAHDTRNREQCKRVRGMMLEIKSYAQLLEADLSRLNQFYNGKKAWPENILKIRQTIYKKRHAQVLMDKKGGSPVKHELDVSETNTTNSKDSSDSGYEFNDTQGPGETTGAGCKNGIANGATFGLRAVGQNLEEHWAEDKDMWLFLASS